MPEAQRLDKTVDKHAGPLLGSKNRLKLAVFGTNLSGGMSLTAAAGSISVSWEEQVRLAQAADEAGFEGLVPVARWKGYSGASRANERSFDTLTWAAGVAAVTRRLQVFATVHVPTVHPVRLAKEVATIDHISGGRFALNVVAGWNQPEMSMFGTTLAEHDKRYELADEWLSVTKQLWEETKPFDFSGSYFNGEQLLSEPKPVQRPTPVIMSAGVSPAGRRFAAKHADLCFGVADTEADLGPMAADIRRTAGQEFGREVSVFGSVFICCASSQRAAEAKFEQAVDAEGDWQAAQDLASASMGTVQSLTGGLARENLVKMVAGSGAVQIIGTPELVVERLAALSGAGLDGVTLSWTDYEEGIAQFREDILPLAVEAGLRQPLDAR
jgi:FMNH2-dependent dimethyl sulfone monooxygenase